MPAGDTCVVIPVHNEEAVIQRVVAEVLAAYPKVVCVDDGSTDVSASEIAKTDAALVRHPINLGQGAALQTGIEFALLDPTTQYFVTFDADGQHRVEDVKLLLSVLREGEHDIVLGSRFLDAATKVTMPRRLILTAAVRYTNLTCRVRLTDTHNGLRAFNRRVAEALDIRMGGMAHASEIIALVGRCGFRYAEVR